MSWTIYCHTHIDSGRRYVGLTKRTMGRRWSQHVCQARSSKGGRWHFPNAIRKYGKDAFSHEVLEVCDTLEDANAAEVRWINHFDTRNPEKGFNLKKGGSHVPHPIKNPWDRPSYREKVSSSIRARWEDPATRARNVAGLRAKMSTSEYRANCSEAQRGKTLSSEHRAKISENTSRQHASRSVGERKTLSRRMHVALREKESSRTDEEIRRERNRKSRTSKSLNTISAVQTPEAKAKHREKCSKLSEVDIVLALSLRAEGRTQSEVAAMFGVTRKAIAYHERRRS